MNEMKSYKVRLGIIEAMVGNNLDPSEFYEFMKKYAEFISLGITNSKMLAIADSGFDDISKMASLTKGTECFAAFLNGFEEEYKVMVLNTASKAKKK